MAVLELRQVSFSYHESKADSITSLNLKVNKGEFILLCGKSGCGKTTVTRLLNGLVPHFYEGRLTGEVLVNGQSIREVEPGRLATLVGSVFQDPRSQFFTTDTTSEIAFACENIGMARTLMQERLRHTVSTLNIAKLMDRSIFDLSSGEKQKIALASVYAAGPSVYVLDEPSANLDHQATIELKKILGLLKEQGCTVVIAEHRLYYLRELVDRVIYMEQGRIVEEFDRKSFLGLPDRQRLPRGLRCIFPEKLTLQQGGAAVKQAEALELEGLCFSYADGSPVDFAINPDSLARLRRLFGFDFNSNIHKAEGNDEKRKCHAQRAYL